MLVLGMHRSGTSALTGALARFGAYVGEADELLPAASDNAAGFFERKDVIEVTQGLLNGGGGDWWRLARLDLDTVPADTLATCRGRFSEIVEKLDRQGAWVIKDPRLCLILPCLLDLLDRPVAVIVHRNPLDVARSLHRRDGIAVAEGLALWEAYYRRALHDTRHIPRIVISYEALCENPQAVLSDLVGDLKSLGITSLQSPDAKSARDAVPASLQHHATSAQETDDFLLAGQRELVEILRAGTLGTAVAPSPGPLVQQILRDLEYHRGTLARREKAEAGLRTELQRQREQVKERDDTLVKLRADQTHAQKKLAVTNRLLETRHAELTELTRQLARAHEQRDKAAKTFGPQIVSAVARFWVGPFRKLREDLRISRLRRLGVLDEAWYAEAYPDVRESGMRPGRHYLRHGASEGRHPSPAYRRMLDKD